MDNAQEKALAIIKKHDNDLVFAKPEDLQTTALFVPVVTVLQPTAEDFHKITGGKAMPKGHYTDKIGEASGVDFLDEACRVEKIEPGVWVGRAQGRKRLGDGQWRRSTPAEYEWDANARAEEDFLKNPGQYSDEIKKRQHVLELCRFGRQRAGTGARLRVIRQLAGIPIAFSPDDIRKAMVVSRIAVNVDGLLETPGMQQAAINVAFGVGGAAERLLGPAPDQDALPAPEERDITAEAEGGGGDGDAPPAAAGFPEQDENGDEPRDGAGGGFLTPLEEARQELEEWSTQEIIKKDQGALIVVRAALDNKSATLEDVDKLNKRCRAFAKRETPAKETK